MHRLPLLAAALPRLSRPVPRRLVPQIHLVDFAFSSRAVFRHQFSTSTKITTCPQCSALLPTPLPVCPNCSYISTIPQEMTYHEMLGASYEPNPFVVKTLQLKTKFRDLQSVVHPDRWVGKSEVRVQNIFVWPIFIPTL